MSKKRINWRLFLESTTYRDLLWEYAYKGMSKVELERTLISQELKREVRKFPVNKTARAMARKALNRFSYT